MVHKVISNILFSTYNNSARCITQVSLSFHSEGRMQFRESTLPGSKGPLEDSQDTTQGFDLFHWTMTSLHKQESCDSIKDKS